MYLYRLKPLPSLAAMLDAKHYIANVARTNGPWRTLLPIKREFYDLKRKLHDMRVIGILRR